MREVGLSASAVCSIFARDRRDRLAVLDTVRGIGTWWDDVGQPVLLRRWILRIEALLRLEVLLILVDPRRINAVAI